MLGSWRLCLPLLFLHHSQSLSIRSPRPSIDAVKSVISRLPSWVGQQFSEIVISPSEALQKGEARLIGDTDGIRIEGRSPVDALYAVNAYLREFCRSMITWDGMNVPSNGTCERPDAFQRHYHSPKIRYFGNPRLFSTSFVWWNWEKWQRFIDWLALSGFNMVLMPVGQEAIWRDVWQEMGLSRQSLDDFFTGPAFLAWHRMGQLQKFAGPLSDDYMEEQLELGKRIVKRMTSLGMVPVLPSFNGVVPRDLSRSNESGESDREKQGDCWKAFDGEYSCLSSLSPVHDRLLFHSIAKSFIQRQWMAFGTKVGQVYSADPYFSSNDASSATETAKMILSSCRAADRKCIWLLRSSLFDDWSADAVRAFSSALPVGKLLIVDDSNAQHKHSFGGHFTIWNNPEGLRGGRNLRGRLFNARQKWHEINNSGVKKIEGAGLGPETISQNYAIYQHFIELIWHENIPFKQWPDVYARARYGLEDEAMAEKAADAWKMIVATFYDVPEEVKEEDWTPYIYRRPQIAPNYTYYWFNPEILSRIANNFTQLHQHLSHNILFRQDWADVRREYLEYLIGNHAILRINEGLGLSDKVIIRQGCDRMERHFEELDLVLKESLGDLLEDARRAATSDREADLFEQQTKNQLTLFGPPAANALDSVPRQLSGLIRQYYGARWSHFCAFLKEYEPRNGPFDEAKLAREIHETVELPFGALL